MGSLGTSTKEKEQRKRAPWTTVARPDCRKNTTNLQKKYTCMEENREQQEKLQLLASVAEKLAFFLISADPLQL